MHCNNFKGITSAFICYTIILTQFQLYKIRSVAEFSTDELRSWEACMSYTAHSSKFALILFILYLINLLKVTVLFVYV
jgi:hypothetical protein